MAAGPENFPGVYRSDEFGTVEFTVREGRVSGRHYGGGSCRHEGRRVIEGTFEGTVLVGRVLLCQSGTACEDDFFDFLAFYDPLDRSLVANVQPSSGGCSAPSLSMNKWLKLKAVDRQPPKLKADVHKRNDALGIDAMKQAHQLTQAGKFAEARKNWLIGLSVFDTNWVGYLGLGVSEIRLNRVHTGLEALEIAKDLASMGPSSSQHAFIYFNMACGYALLGDNQRAFELLRKTYEVGAVTQEELESQKDLAALHDDRKQWEEIVMLARSKVAKDNR